MTKPASSSRLNYLLLAAQAGSFVWVWKLNRQIDAQATQLASIAADLKTERKRASDTEEQLVAARSRPVEPTAPPAPAPEAGKDASTAPDVARSQDFPACWIILRCKP